MGERRCCAGCGIDTPESSTLETTWSKFGWRVVRRKGEGAQIIVEFLCPACWRQRRDQSPPA